MSKITAIAIKFDIIQCNLDIVALSKCIFSKIEYYLCNCIIFGCDNCNISTIGCNA